MLAICSGDFTKVCVRNSKRTISLINGANQTKHLFNRMMKICNFSPHKLHRCSWCAYSIDDDIRANGVSPKWVLIRIQKKILMCVGLKQCTRHSCTFTVRCNTWKLVSQHYVIASISLAIIIGTWFVCLSSSNVPLHLNDLLQNVVHLAKVIC